MKNLLTILTLFSLMTSLSAQTTWEKQYPKTSDRLHDVYAFDADTAVACGNNGEIWRTTDGGTNWNSITSPTTNELRDITFYGKDGWIVGDYIVLHSTDSGKSWAAQSTPSHVLSGVDFISSTQGWAAASSGTIYKTTNGGSTWSTYSTGTTNWLTAIDFYDSQHGWVVGWNSTYGYTTDGGANWYVTAGTSGAPILLDVKFFSNLVGLRVGENLIQRTTDGGGSWTAAVTLPVGSTIQTKTIESISIPTSSSAYVSATGGKVIHSSDYGENWSEYTAGNGDGDLYSISSPSTPSSQAWTVGNRGVIFKSTNSGAAWSSQVKENTSYELTSVYYADQNNGWATTLSHDGTLLKTTNGGEDWTTTNLNTTWALNDITFTSANIGYIVGDDDKVFYTSDAGANWTEHNTTGGGNLTSVSFLNDNIGFIGADGNGGNGYIFKTFNRGNSWTKTDLGIPIYDITVVNASTIIAVGYGGAVYKSTDLGANWNSITTGLDGDNGDILYGVTFPQSSIGYACGTNGIILKTDDAGDSWSQLNSGCSETFNDIFFFDSQHGWVVGGSGLVLYTVNGGTSWDAEDSKTQNDLDALFFPLGQHGWAVGKSGTVIKATIDPLLSAPGPAQEIYPIDGGIDVAVDADLEWDSWRGGEPTGYKLYLGTDGDGTTTPTNIVNGTDLGNVKTYDPTSDFSLNTIYYWQVVPYNTHGDASNCPIWSFTTRESDSYGGGGTQCPGYFFANSLPGASGAPSQPNFNWIDPVDNNHTSVSHTNDWTAGNYDEGYKLISIGFSFPFFGTNYTNLYIGSNGVITFDNGYLGPGTNVSIPSTDTPNNMIAVLLMDLESNTSDPYSNVYYKSTSSELIVTWYKYLAQGTSDTISFQAILKPSGYILFQYNDALSTTPLPNSIGNDALIGIEDETGTMGLGYRNNGAGGEIFPSSPPPPSKPKGNYEINGTTSDSEVAVAFGEEADGLTPVELTSFTANVIDNSVELNWQTATEVNNYGFEILRSAQSDSYSEEQSDEESWETLGFVQGHGNSNSPKKYSFTDENPPSGKVKYRLKQIDVDGQFEYSDVVEVNTGAPNKFELEQNYPNPFNPTTTIKYSIPSVIARSGATRQSLVQLKVYDILGREVKTLVNKEQAPGNYSVKFDASQLSSEIYFYRLQSGKFIQTRKMILMK